jgi:hypothetical protein
MIGSGRNFPSEPEPTHPRAAHQIGHAIDHDDRAQLRLKLIQQEHQPRRVFAIRDMDHEDELRCAQVALNRPPLLFIQCRAEVVSGHFEAHRILTLDLSLRLFERREQARPDVEHCDFKRRLQVDLPVR